MDEFINHMHAEDFREYAHKQRSFEDEHYDPFIDNNGDLNLCLSDIFEHIAVALDEPETINEPTLRLLLAEIRCLLDGRVEDADWAFDGSGLDALMADLKLVEGIFDRRIREIDRRV